MTAFNVLDYLANLTGAPADYLSGTYEPAIGQPDGADAITRIVNTNDMATAALRFADLIDGDIDEKTTEYTWSDDQVGTLVYTKGDGATAWATVDVSIKQIPRLQKIVYRSPEQAGDNTSAVEGTAYYRFGDVVKKMNADGEDEYWICVRPAFYPEGKGDSHWATISPLPTKNIATYTGSNGIDYALPTGLGDSHEHSQNFAEMLFAICYPEQWEQNIRYNLDDKNMRMFHDFDRKKMKYHSQYFWQRVQVAWTDSKVINEVFGKNYTLAALQAMLTSNDGLNLLTTGYSWKWNLLNQNSPTLYRYRFVNGTGKESNMHKEPIKGGFINHYHSVKKEVIKAKITLNCKAHYNSTTPGWSVPEFFGTKNGHFIIRHATGAELASDGKENPKLPLTGVTEEYRYNAFYNITDLDADPEVLTSADGGSENAECSYYNFGDVVKDERGNKWFCVQTSTFGSDRSTPETNYSYFVSYDMDAVREEKLTHSKELAAQMLFSMSSWFHNAANSAKDPTMAISIVFDNIKEHAGVDLFDVFAQRDTLFKTSNFGVQTLQCDFASTIYRNAQGKFCVLRLIVDYTTEQANGNRDMAWRFWDSYTADPNRIMLYDDLSDSLTISRYNEDEWVYLPWYNPVTGKQVTYHRGKLVADDYYVAPTEIPVYVKGMSAYNGMAWNNIYREPTFAFAVKRVKDVGTPGNAFEDGTFFNHVSMLRDNPNLSDVFMDAAMTISWNTTRILQYDNYLKGNQITLNGKQNRFDFTVTNKP